MERIEDKYPGIAFRAAFVGYRDIYDDPQFVIDDFTGAISTVKDTIKDQLAYGGVDVPEDV